MSVIRAILTFLGLIRNDAKRSTVYRKPCSNNNPNPLFKVAIQLGYFILTSFLMASSLSKEHNDSQTEVYQTTFTTDHEISISSQANGLINFQTDNQQMPHSGENIPLSSQTAHDIIERVVNRGGITEARSMSRLGDDIILGDINLVILNEQLNSDQTHLGTQTIATTTVDTPTINVAKSEANIETQVIKKPVVVDVVIKTTQPTHHLAEADIKQAPINAIIVSHDNAIGLVNIEAVEATEKPVMDTIVSANNYDQLIIEATPLILDKPKVHQAPTPDPIQTRPNAIIVSRDNAIGLVNIETVEATEKPVIDTIVSASDYDKVKVKPQQFVLHKTMATKAKKPVSTQIGVTTSPTIDVVTTEMKQAPAKTVVVNQESQPTIDVAKSASAAKQLVQVEKESSARTQSPAKPQATSRKPGMKYLAINGEAVMKRGSNGDIVIEYE